MPHHSNSLEGGDSTACLRPRCLPVCELAVEGASKPRLPVYMLDFLSYLPQALGAEGAALLAGCLCSMHQTLDSIPGPNQNQTCNPRSREVERRTKSSRSFSATQWVYFCLLETLSCKPNTEQTDSKLLKRILISSRPLSPPPSPHTWPLHTQSHSAQGRHYLTQGSFCSGLII